jgi:hypothetical protein
MAASLAPYRSTRDMRVSRSLPSAPSDSTRGPLQYFNSLLEHLCVLVLLTSFVVCREPIRESPASIPKGATPQAKAVESDKGCFVHSAGG